MNFFYSALKGGSRSPDWARAHYLPSWLTFASSDQPNKKGMSHDDFKPTIVNRSPLLISFCSQCQACQDAHDPTPYHGLQHPRAFRLLELFPGSMDDLLVGHLRCYTLDDAKDHYEALSYSWRGSHSINSFNNCGIYQITCNDLNIDVQANLWLALRRIRLLTRSRMLWIDGIWKVETISCVRLTRSY
jgi:hypothetical protein